MSNSSVIDESGKTTVGNALQARRKNVFFIHPLIDRIGELVLRIWELRNIYDERKYEINLITPPFESFPRMNKSVFALVTRGMNVLQSRDQSILGLAWRRDLGVIEDEDSIHVLLPIDKLHALFIETLKDQKPIFHYALSDSEIERGNLLRAQFGIPPAAAIVTLHVRERGYFGKDEGGDFYRNSNIQHYLPALQYLIDQGFYVVRLGDKSMTRIPIHSPRMIDVPHHSVSSDFADAYFTSVSKFFIGCGSGPDNLATGFGIPVLYMNWQVHAGNWGKKRDLFAPKKYYSKKLHRYLTFEEMILAPVFDFCRDRLYEQSGIEIHENSPQEILMSVKEMNARLDGQYGAAELITRTEQRFRAIQKKAHCYRQNFLNPNVFPYEPFLGSYWSNLGLSIEYLKSNPWFLGHDWPEVVEWGMEPRLAVQ